MIKENVSTFTFGIQAPAVLDIPAEAEFTDSRSILLIDTIEIFGGTRAYSAK